ncbi:MAG: NAD(P)H-dependent glycerol-3-phosphate dehydrogenase [Cytophagales bacterium]|nr:MAG: NAD(P)H-dependent glycerol-3-phosphate dehydrogenase [Cytophagales bacterium]TAF61279.1 MAG: NAD(P)H-dependent glycerol-3-phosphate dehydrogenase [Cytophagales bacterium]
MSATLSQKPIAIAVIGGGSWATALVKILSENNVSIRWWLRSREAIKHIKTHGNNPDYLSSVRLDLQKISPYENIIEAVQEAEFVLVAVPSAFLQDALKPLNSTHLKGKKIVTAIKGMIASHKATITDYMKTAYGTPDEDLLVVAGPCHAEEVALERQSYLTISSTGSANAERFSGLIRNRYVRCATNQDPSGTQYCFVLKNIVALACGIAKGLNYGDNFQSVLVSNALQEIKRFLDAVSPFENRDLSGSAYLGDLLVTAYSQFSRNRTFGSMIGRGYSVKSAQMEMNMIAEGYYAVKSIYEINRDYGVSMPITTATYNILYEKIAPLVEFKILKDSMK